VARRLYFLVVLRDDSKLRGLTVPLKYNGLADKASLPGVNDRSLAKKIVYIQYLPTITGYGTGPF
jgi:hypothetical protein